MWSESTPRIALDGRAGDRLAIGHDRERLEAGRREPHRVRADIARDQRADLGGGCELDPVPDREQPNAALPQAHLEVAEPLVDGRHVDAGDRRDLASRERPLGDEEQRLEPGLGQLAGCGALGRAVRGRCDLNVETRSCERVQRFVERRRPRRPR